MLFNALNTSRPVELALIMPIYNEGLKIIPCVTTLAFTVQVPLRLIFVYDHDQDPTLSVLKELKPLFPNIRLVKNADQGVIGAIKTGFKANDCEVVGIWLAYHIDPFGLVNQMFSLAKNGCQLVSGNRFNKIKRISRGNPVKKILSRGGNFILNRLIGIPLGDITTSIKLYQKKFIDETPIETTRSGGWALSTELAVKAAVKGCKIGEIEFRPENTNILHGLTNFKVFRQLDQYLKWLLWGFVNSKRIKGNYADPSRFIKMPKGSFSHEQEMKSSKSSVAHSGLMRR